jgi:hypothetical protein
MKKQTVRSQRMDAMGDRLKAYERIETEKRFRPNSILYVRLCGRYIDKYYGKSFTHYIFTKPEIVTITTYTDYIL